MMYSIHIGLYKYYIEYSSLNEYKSIAISHSCLVLLIYSFGHANCNNQENDCGKTLLSISIIAIIANLTGCATNPFSPQKENVNSPEVTKSTNTAVGGQIETAMDENDKEKMYRALDKPLGKPTDWVNEKTRD